MSRPRGQSNRPYPSVSLATALQASEAISEKNAGRPMNRLLLAEAMGYSPSSSGFRERVTASAKYGLTEGNYNSETINLTSLGVEVTRPRNEAERIEAKRHALREIPLFNDLINHYTNAKLPGPEFLKHVLERASFNIDPSWSAAAAEAFTEDAREVGYLRIIGGSPTSSLMPVGRHQKTSFSLTNALTSRMTCHRTMLLAPQSETRQPQVRQVTLSSQDAILQCDLSLCSSLSPTVRTASR